MGRNPCVFVEATRLLSLGDVGQEGVDYLQRGQGAGEIGGTVIRGGVVPAWGGGRGWCEVMPCEGDEGRTGWSSWDNKRLQMSVSLVSYDVRCTTSV